MSFIFAEHYIMQFSRNTLYFTRMKKLDSWKGLETEALTPSGQKMRNSTSFATLVYVKAISVKKKAFLHRKCCKLLCHIADRLIFGYDGTKVFDHWDGRGSPPDTILVASSSISASVTSFFSLRYSCSKSDFFVRF